jgi:hypothetical protein
MERKKRNRVTDEGGWVYWENRGKRIYEGSRVMEYRNNCESTRGNEVKEGRGAME